MAARKRTGLTYQVDDDPEAQQSSLNKPKRTLSVYGKRTQHLDVVDRPLTSFMQNDKYMFMRNNQIREIESLKHRLNRNKVKLLYF